MFQGSLSSKDSPRAMTSSASFDSAAAAAAVTASNPCRSQSSGLEQQGAIRKTSAASSSTNTERLRSQPSQISLGGSSSHQSEASRSYETVVNMGRSSRRSIERNRWVTKSNLLVSDSVEDTEDEIEAIRKAEREHHHHRSSRGNSGGRRREGGAEEDFRPPPERRRQHGAGASRTSSLATTSDEEKHESHRPSRSEGGGRVRAGERADGRKQELQLPATNSSTMESAQIDRAKSFEYFPGESFPIQENSSSYEYLPGHLVNDRPATVVSNYQNEPDFNISGITSLSSTTDQSSDQLDNRGSNRRGEAGGGKRKSSRKDGNAAAGFQDQDLDAIAEELNKRSHALLEAHMNKTKHFYRKMKKYISYVSTPSVTAEDSRKKQEILEKLLGLMAKQESNLESRHLTRPISVQTSVISEESEGRRSDLPTRALESAADLRAESPTIHEKSQISTDCSSTTSHADTQGKRSSLESRSGPAKIVKKISKNPSSSSGSRTREEKNSTTPRDGDSLPHPNVEIHRQRIEQMRVLRQEIKKLERLECANIKQLVGGKLPFMPEPSDMSDESSLISTSTYVTDPTEKLRSRQQQQASSTTRGGAAGIAKRLGTEGKSSSDSNNAKKKGKSLMSDKVLPGAARVPPGAKPVTKSKYVDIKTKGKASESSQKSLSGRPGNSSSRSVSRATESKSSRSASSAAASKSLADFGQTYPTPREQQPSTVSSSAAQTTAQTNSRGIQTEPRPVQLEIISSPEPKKMPRSKKKKVMKKAPPVAYYLPFSNDSPIKIGTRIIRERIQEEGIGRENRNILANYMAGLDSGAIFRDGGNSRSETATRISSRPRDNDHDDDSSGDFSNLLTLQDALAAKRPDFVAKADQRMHWLHQAKLQRLAMEEKKKQWILDVARMDSKERKMAKPNFSPVKIRRIFNYREMVEKTRQKYQQLPEVRYQAYETKRKSLYQTNRIMKDMYKQKLKENVLGGKVSLNHFKDVIQI